MSEPEPIARIRISLDDVRPEVRRRVEVPLAMTMKGLHDVIQAAMGWLDCHLFEFQAGDRRYGIPDPHGDEPALADARMTKLQGLVDRDIASLRYTYDFGDDWVHSLTVEAVAPAEPARTYPRFIDGAGAAPPEDIGGPPGFAAFRDAIAGQRKRKAKR